VNLSVVRPRSLRVRLTLLFVALGSVLVVAASIGVSYLLGRAVWTPLDISLEEEAEELGEIAATATRPDPSGHPHEEHGLPAAAARIGAERDLGNGKFVEILAADGTRLAAHGAPPTATIAADAIRRRTFEFVINGGSTYRVVHLPIEGGGWVTMGVRAERQIHSLLRARLALGAGATAFVLALGALALRITTRATDEIDAVAADLEALEADSLHRRIDPGSTSEVDRLVVALNRMLERLDEAVSHLRRFTADAAHELRTPISALRARIEGTLSGEASVESFRDGLLDSLEQTERLSRLAEDLLTLSAVEAAASLPRELVDLSHLADEVAEFFAPIAVEQGRVLQLATERGCFVEGSTRLLKRVLVNIIDNAFRHTQSGGAVRLGVRHRDDSVRLEVRDDGPGFDTGNQGPSFRRFARGTSENAGAGLGLALCNEIIRKHDGTIAVESSATTGTTVVVELPALLPAAATGEPSDTVIDVT
jgi:signal transduction histidine kinase